MRRIPHPPGIPPPAPGPLPADPGAPLPGVALTASRPDRIGVAAEPCAIVIEVDDPDDLEDGLERLRAELEAVAFSTELV